MNGKRVDLGELSSKWEHLGASVLGPSWGHVGAVWGPSWTLWGQCFVLFGLRIVEKLTFAEKSIFAQPSDVFADFITRKGSNLDQKGGEEAEKRSQDSKK